MAKAVVELPGIEPGSFASHDEPQLVRTGDLETHMESARRQKRQPITPQVVVSGCCDINPVGERAAITSAVPDEEE